MNKPCGCFGTERNGVFYCEIPCPEHKSQYQGEIYILQ